jgi:ABC-type Mn2+/Zn2+ transport system ATPase subunit
VVGMFPAAWGLFSQDASVLQIGQEALKKVGEKSLRNRKFARLSAGASRIRTFGPGASGEADAILPVKDRPR